MKKTPNSTARKRRGNPTAAPNDANRRVDGKSSTANDPTDANGNGNEASANASNGDRRETNTTTRTKSLKIGKTSGARVRDVGVDGSGKRRCFNL